MLFALVRALKWIACSRFRQDTTCSSFWWLNNLENIWIWAVTRFALDFNFFISWKMLLHIQSLETLNRRKEMQAYWFLNWCLHCGSCHPKDRDNYSKFCWVRNVNHDFHILLNLCFAIWRMQFYVNIFSNFSSKFNLPWL